MDNNSNKNSRLTLSQILGDAIIKKIEEKRSKSGRLKLAEILEPEYSVKKINTK